MPYVLRPPSTVAPASRSPKVGIMISYWIGYGTNFISETSSVSWRIPLAVQCIPALLLMFGVWLIPESPRHLVNVGQEERAREVLRYIRRTDLEDELMNIEFLEIKAEAIFGAWASVHRWSCG
jgi:hypothetical protein